MNDEREPSRPGDDDSPPTEAERLAFVPPTDTPIPPGALTVEPGTTLTAVWQNEAGGLTFGLGDPPFGRFLKWAPTGGLQPETERLQWARGRTPVPELLDRGSVGEAEWFITRAIPGRSAVDRHWIAEPRRAVEAIADGLRAMHDGLVVDDCPFNWTTSDRVAVARRRLETGLITPDTWSPSLDLASAAEAMQLLADPPPADPVVCHGDACVPNTILTDDGRWSGHVDLGALGVGDRWADLAVASWSLDWNYGPGWEPTFFARYGIDADERRIRWFRALWDLT